MLLDMQNVKIIQLYNLNINVRLFANGIIFLTIIILFLNINILKIKENISKQIVSKNLIFNSFDPQKVLNKNHASIFKNKVILKYSLVGLANKDRRSIVVQETGKVKSVKYKQVKGTPLIISIVKSSVIIKEIPPEKVIPKPSPKLIETLPVPAPPKAVEQPKLNMDGLFLAKKGNFNRTTGTNPTTCSTIDVIVKEKDNQESFDTTVKNVIYVKNFIIVGTKSFRNRKEGNEPLLNFKGWKWTNQPIISNVLDETEIVIFRIKVDEDGDVVEVNQIHSTVSPYVVQQYKRAVILLEFKPIINVDKFEISTGTVSFIIGLR